MDNKMTPHVTSETPPALDASAGDITPGGTIQVILPTGCHLRQARYGLNINDGIGDYTYLHRFTGNLTQHQDAADSSLPRKGATVFWHRSVTAVRGSLHQAHHAGLHVRRYDL